MQTTLDGGQFIRWRVQELIPQFEALAPFKINERKKGVPGIKGWKELALEETKLLKLSYPDPEPDEVKRTYTTCHRKIQSLHKELKKVVPAALREEQHKYPVLTIIEHFHRAVIDQFASYKKNINIAYRGEDGKGGEIDTRSQPENRLEIDLSPWLKKAHEVLLAVSEGLKKNELEWRDVSCALALVTGRRMSEIHMSAEISVHSDYELIFKGQLKGKNRKEKIGEQKVKLIDVPFVIPTLVKAELVVAGVEWLENNGKRMPRGTDAELVNNRWSCVLSPRIKEEWLIYKTEETKNTMTYHKFRGLYFRACSVNAGLDVYDWKKFAARILGDDTEQTLTAYKRFMLLPDSITKI